MAFQISAMVKTKKRQVANETLAFLVRKFTFRKSQLAFFLIGRNLLRFLKVSLV